MRDHSKKIKKILTGDDLNHLNLPNNLKTMLLYGTFLSE